MARATHLPEAIRLRWERLDPAAGLGRLLSPAGLSRAAFGTAVACAARALGLVQLSARAALLSQVPRMRAGAAVGEAMQTKPADAERLHRQALALDPNHPPARDNLALLSATLRAQPKESNVAPPPPARPLGPP